jgi:hypothetical protein
VATAQEWSDRIEAEAFRESKTLREREKTVRKMCDEAASDLGLEVFPAGIGYLSVLGIRRMVTEKGYDLPSGATP